MAVGYQRCRTRNSGGMLEMPQVAETRMTDEGDEESRGDTRRLLADLALCLADAAHQGILLTSGPLSRRKTDWVLTRLSEELGQAAAIVERLRREA